MTYVRQVTRLRVQWHILGLYLLAAGFAYVIARLLGADGLGVFGMELMTLTALLSCIRAWKS